MIQSASEHYFNVSFARVNMVLLVLPKFSDKHALARMSLKATCLACAALHVSQVLCEYSIVFQILAEWANWRGVFARFVPVGLCLIAVMQWRNYRKLSTEQTARQWEISCYCALPLRVVSRCWGWLAGRYTITYFDFYAVLHLPMYNIKLVFYP